VSAATTTITAVTPEGPEVPVTSGVAAKRRRLRFVANPKAATGLVVLAFFCLIAIIGPWIAPFDPSARSSDLIQAPSGKHWFGTTHLGQDIFSQVLVGSRGVMFVGLLAGLVATALSVLIGVSAGFLGGAADDSLSALSNVFLVITISVLVANLLADVAYTLLDPRTRKAG